MLNAGGAEGEVRKTRALHALVWENVLRKMVAAGRLLRLA